MTLASDTDPVYRRVVPLHVRTGTAFRFRPTALRGEEADFVRIFEDGGVQIALIANGYECGFSTCWPSASRLILDLFTEAWRDSSGSIRDRLHTAFERARERFAVEAPALITPDADFPDELPAAVLLAVVVEAAAVHMAWIGGDVALVARGFETVAETSPHTLIERFRREQPEIADLSAVPNVITRSISAKSTDRDPPDYLVTEITAGDTLVLLSHAAFSGPSVAVADAAFAAAAYANPAMLAERLAEIDFVNSEISYAAVAVLRFDDVDLASTVDRLVDAYEPEPGHADWLRAWSRANRALPVFFDMGGVVAMKGDGSVISMSWEAPDAPAREETSGAAHLAAVIGAAQRHEALGTLAPRRPRGAAECAECAVLNPDGGRGCPVCWYLGWSPPPAPSWFLDSPHPDDRANEADRPAARLAWWKRLLRRSS
jgi:hypothetical protein